MQQRTLPTPLVFTTASQTRTPHTDPSQTHSLSRVRNHRLQLSVMHDCASHASALATKQCHNLKGDRVMSRYHIAEAPNEVVVGWDPPLQTYFLEVFKVALGGEEEDEILLWLGM